MNGSFDDDNVKVISGLSGPPGNQHFGETNLSAWGSDVKAAFKKYVDIYGSLNYNNIVSERIITVGDIVIQTSDSIFTNWDVYDNCGFVEGQARISTPYGSVACVIKNGTLYPIITEYDQQVEDNKCLTTIYLNGDDEVSGLQNMVDHPGRYLPYDNTTIGQPWSPVENYLHQNVNMPIVPKIGFEPLDEVGMGNALPGLNYEVTL